MEHAQHQDQGDQGTDKADKGAHEGSLALKHVKICIFKQILLFLQIKLGN